MHYINNSPKQSDKFFQSKKLLNLFKTEQSCGKFDNCTGSEAPPVLEMGAAFFFLQNTGAMNKQLPCT